MTSSRQQTTSRQADKQTSSRQAADNRQQTRLNSPPVGPDHIGDHARLARDRVASKFVREVVRVWDLACPPQLGAQLLLRIDVKAVLADSPGLWAPRLGRRGEEVERLAAALKGPRGESSRAVAGAVVGCCELSFARVMRTNNVDATLALTPLQVPRERFGDTFPALPLPFQTPSW